MPPVPPAKPTHRAGPRGAAGPPTRRRPPGRPPPTAGYRPAGAVPGRLGYELPSIDLGPVPVSLVARQAISDTIDRELNKARLTEGFALEAIQAREGAVTLVGRFR
jgi:hypothetical protein